jgi:MFS family permease
MPNIMPALSFSVLRNRDFRLLLLIRMFGMMALQAQAVIVGWQIYTITKDPFMLGMVGLTEAVPAIIASLFAGHIVDVYKPHRVFLICVAVLMVNTFLLFLIGGDLIHVGDIVPWIFAGVFISGLARSFITPASFSILPKIVERSQMSASSAWMTSFFQIAIIGGPAIAGIIYGGFGARAAWMIPSSLLFAEFFLLVFMSAHIKKHRSENKREKAAESIKQGWHFILQNRILLSVMALDMFAVLFGGAVAMLPAIADQVLHVGSEGLGALRAAPAVGAVITALVLAVVPFKQIRGSLMLWAVAGFGLCIIGFGLSTSFWLSLVLLAVSGAFDSISMVIRSTMVQWLTPDHMRGRVSSVNAMFIISSNEIGAFRAGVQTKWMGLVPSVVWGGVATIAIVIGTALAVPKLRKLKLDAEKV